MKGSGELTSTLPLEYKKVSSGLAPEPSTEDWNVTDLIKILLVIAMICTKQLDEHLDFQEMEMNEAATIKTSYNLK